MNNTGKSPHKHPQGHASHHQYKPNNHANGQNFSTQQKGNPALANRNFPLQQNFGSPANPHPLQSGNRTQGQMSQPMLGNYPGPNGGPGSFYGR